MLTPVIFVPVAFIIGIVWGGVQLGPLGTAATNRPIVPAPGDYDDGEMIGRENRSTRRKPAPVALCPPQTPHALPRRQPCRRGGKPATNRLSYGTTIPVISFIRMNQKTFPFQMPVLYK
jgi:hypothetical protein